MPTAYAPIQSKSNPISTSHILQAYATRSSPNSGACMHIGSPLAIADQTFVAVKLHKRLCVATGEVSYDIGCIRARTLTAWLFWALLVLRRLCGRLGSVYRCSMLCNSCTSDRDWIIFRPCMEDVSSLAGPALLCDKSAAIVWLWTAETTPCAVHPATSLHHFTRYTRMRSTTQPNNLQRHTYVDPTEMKKCIRPTTIPATHHRPVL
jgi:hypothetical protein